MIETHTPRQVQPDPSTSISDYVLRHAAEIPEETMLRRKVGDGWEDICARELLDLVRGIAKGLQSHGFGRGDHIAIMSRTRLEWTLADLAIWHIGGVAVPIYETSSTAQAQWILSDSGCVAVFAETHQLAAVIEEAHSQEGGHQVREVFIFDDDAVETLRADGAGISDAEADSALAAVGLSDVATIIYTSGTTGRPKGAELTHGNFVELSEETLRLLPQILKAPGASTLLFLPLAHVFARFMEVLAIVSALPMGHTPDAKQMVLDIGTFQPTILLSVPRVWEKVYNSAELKQGKGAKRSLFRWSAKVAVSYSRALAAPGGPPAGLRAAHALASKLVYSKLRHLLGGRLQWTISGGAPLGERLGNFYQGIGMGMLEGYGLTETTAPTNVNLPGKIKIGTVGPPLPGTSVRIAEDGEILVKGVGIFPRYHNNPEATAAVFEDGWFRTGDVGSLDEDGYLTITGRKKEIIVTAAGKNVAPSQLEDPLRSHPLISQVVVVGDNQPFIGALVTLDAEVLPRWLETHDLPAMTAAEAAENPVVREHIQMAIDRVNRKVSRAESIREIRILTDDFTQENDMLTPSMKVKRHVVHQRYRGVIDSIYAGVQRSHG